MEWISAARIAETLGGFLLIVLTLLDVFMTVLYARLGKGIFSKRLARAIWRAFDTLASHYEPARERLLPIAGPVILIAVVVAWGLLVILGFALVIHPALGSGIVSSTGNTSTDFVTAIYVAGDSMTTVGTSDMAPKKGFYRLVYLLDSLMGISLITLTVTYLLEVYNALLSHNTFGLRLHMATGQSGSAAEWLARLGPDDRFDIGHASLAELAGEIAHLKESVHFYPVSLYFRFQGDHYALPRQLLIMLDAVALCRTALDRASHRWLQESASLCTLDDVTAMLLDTLCNEFIPSSATQAPHPPMPEEPWRAHFVCALRRLAAAGIPTAHDEAAAEARYVQLRHKWQRQIDMLARYLDYRTDQVDSARAKSPVP
jgi:hypothetical protein